MNLKTPNDMTPEEAQAIIKANMKDMAKIVQDAIGVLHPELAGSEDERIINQLITLVNSTGEVLLIPTNKEELIAWLEMQKEQKPEERFEEAREKYQVEWSEEDNIGWDEAFACVTRAEKAAKNEEELQNAVTAEKWLKEIKFKYCVHPVKQEWSGRDEEILEFVLGLLDNLVWRRDWEISQAECLEWLVKSLNPTKQEWGEEDEKMRINILNALTPQLVYSVGKGTCTGTSTYKYDDEIKWLKSLRPSWKPSEEQMEALERASTNKYLSAKQFDILVSLYEQLKKLGVEEEPEYYQHFDPDC